MVGKGQQCSFRFPLWQGFPKAVNAWIILSNLLPSCLPQQYLRFLPYHHKPLPSLAKYCVSFWVTLGSLSFLFSCKSCTSGEMKNRSLWTAPWQRGGADSVYSSCEVAVPCCVTVFVPCDWPLGSAVPGMPQYTVSLVPVDSDLGRMLHRSYRVPDSAL